MTCILGCKCGFLVLRTFNFTSEEILSIWGLNSQENKGQNFRAWCGAAALMRASPYAALKVSCLVASYLASTNDKTGIIKGEICFADTDPDNACVLQCSPCVLLALCLLCLLHWKICAGQKTLKSITAVTMLTNLSGAEVGGWVFVAVRRAPNMMQRAASCLLSIWGRICCSFF